MNAVPNEFPKSSLHVPKPFPLQTNGAGERVKRGEKERETGKEKKTGVAAAALGDGVFPLLVLFCFVLNNDGIRGL